jgi:hypothetical protein
MTLREIYAVADEKRRLEALLQFHIQVYENALANLPDVKDEDEKKKCLKRVKKARRLRDKYAQLPLF